MKAIASPSNPLSKKKKISLSRLAEEPFILQTKGRLNRDVIESFFAKKNLPLRIVMEFDTQEAIKEAVKKNFGVSIVQEYILSSELAAKSLKVLPVEDLGINLTLSMIFRREKTLSAVAQNFVDFVRQARAKR
jgi:DNA-binding transcriptional LysR family regulator